MLALAGAGSAAVRGESAPTTLLYAEGESFGVTKQIFEGLVDLRPGTTVVMPKLATSWHVDRSGKVWTFNLRHGVKFQDGTAFNAKAVCFNFNRWFNFPGAFQ